MNSTDNTLPQFLKLRRLRCRHRVKLHISLIIFAIFYNNRINVTSQKSKLVYSTIARTGERNAIFSFLFNPDNTAYKKDSADIIRGLNHYLYSILQGLQSHIEFRRLIYRIPLLRCRPFTKRRRILIRCAAILNGR